MIAHLNGKTYQIDFRYGSVDVHIVNPKTGEDVVETRRTTTAYLSILEGEKKVDGLLSGYSECSVLDNFRKETGRKIALARLLEEMNLSKEERREIWSVYLSRKGGK